MKLQIQTAVKSAPRTAPFNCLRDSPWQHQSRRLASRKDQRRVLVADAGDDDSSMIEPVEDAANALG